MRPNALKDQAFLFQRKRLGAEAHGFMYNADLILHCRYDIPAAVPNGSIQRAGENLLALLREVANSTHLSDPTKEDVHGKIVFFDIFGLMTVVYSERVAMVLNIALVLLVVLTFLGGIDWTESDDQGILLQ